jgi:hypothetical protein
MPTIDKQQKLITFINVFAVDPAKQIHLPDRCLVPKIRAHSRNSRQNFVFIPPSLRFGVARRG